MGVVKTGVSALGKLLTVVVLAGAFLAGMVGVVYLSLRGEEVKVPEIVGKDYYQSEKELAALGLKVKKIAARYSQEKPNTVLEQRPRAGDTAKTGLMVSVIVSEPNPEGSEAPAPVKKPVSPDEEETDATDLEPDKPKKANANTKTKKPAQSTRDVISNKSNKNANSDSANGSSGNSNGAKANSNGGATNNSAAPTNKAVAPAGNSNKPPPKPTPNKPAADGDTRPRRTP